MRRFDTRPAFTLLEVLAVIGVIVVLIALLLPAVHMAREAARRADCQSKLRQLGLAVHQYHEIWAILPTGIEFWPNLAGRPDLMTEGSMFVKLLPFVERHTLYASINHTLSMWLMENSTITGVRLSLLVCPSDYKNQPRNQMTPYWPPPYFVGPWKAALTSFAGSGGANLAFYEPEDGVFGEHCAVRIVDITDGTSQTFLFGERAHSRLPDDYWGFPEDNLGWWSLGASEGTVFTAACRLNPSLPAAHLSWLDVEAHGICGQSAFSMHPGGAHFCFADNSVRFLSEKIDSWQLTRDDVLQCIQQGIRPNKPRGLYQHLATRNGGEVIAGDF
jgi:prepilin-type processing-associated H-X9-DG protein